MAYAKFEALPTQFVDANGDPLSGGSLTFRLTGTSTEAAVYSDSAGTALATGAVTLNSRGTFQTIGGTPVEVYGDTSVTYDATLKDSAGTTVDTYDNIKPLAAAAFSGSTGSSLVGYRSRTAYTKFDDFRNPEDDGAAASGTDATTEIDAIIAEDADTPGVLPRQMLHDSSVWEWPRVVDSKTQSGKGSKYSIASLPRFYRKLVEYNESTSTGLTIVGMGSSVGNGAGLSAPTTDNPLAKFVDRLETKLNKLSIYSFAEQNSSVNGTTLSGGLSIIDSVISTYTPDIMFLVYGMNDGGTNQFNTNQTYPFVSSNLKTIIQKCHDADCDVVICTTPHPDTVDQTWSFTSTLAMSYPVSSWISAQNYTFTAATNRITATTSGSFTNTSLGFGLTVGRSVNVSGSASNDGTYTIATIDASGDYITVSESISDEASVSCTVKRVAIQDSEIIPTPANSVVSVDALGYGAGHEIDVSYRHYRVNQSMRRVGIEMGVPVIDVEHYWFEAVYRHGVANLFDGAEVVHPNDTGYRQSYEYAINEFVDAIAESYQHGIQQNSLLPYLSVNTTTADASATIKEKASTTTIVDIVNSSDTILFSFDSSAGLTVEENTPATFGTLTTQIGGNTTVDNKVSSFGNVAIASPKDVATQSNSGGYIVVEANNAGIGRQTVIYAYSNNGGTVTLSSAISSVAPGGTVVTGSASSGNIRLTVAADNTNIRYRLIEMSA